MPLFIVRQDITTMKVDAIVNAANSSLLGGGGVDGAIHRAAGKRLAEECSLLGGCKTGDAKLTKGYRLPCKYVIHTVGPVWRGGDSGEEALLRSCYLNSLTLAESHGCSSVAFPLISSGIYGYPKAAALRVASDTISAFLEHSDMLVYLTVIEPLPPDLIVDNAAALDDYLRQSLSTNRPAPGTRPRLSSLHSAKPKDAQHIFKEYSLRPSFPTADRDEMAERHEHAFLPHGSLLEEECAHSLSSISIPGIDEQLAQMDESFSQQLLRLIDRRGMTDAQCYKRANIDRRLFSKIRSDANYRPSKATVLAFAVALELSPEETNTLLTSAGFALSRSSKFDIIVEFFIKNGIYNIYTINEALFAYDQNLLGSM